MSQIEQALSTPSAHRLSPSVARIGVWILLCAGLSALGLAPLAMPDSYSWVEHGTSESGAQGIDGAWAARAGFILFGLSVLWLLRLRSAAWGPIASLLHLGFGVSMFGVAAFSTKPWEDGAVYVESEDWLHSLFAGIIGFGFVAGVVTLIIVRRNRSLRAAIPDWIAVVITGTIPLAMDSDIWGALQRIMFLTAGLWYAREAALAASSPSGPQQGPVDAG